MGRTGFAGMVRAMAGGRHPGNRHVAAEVEAMLANFGDDPATVIPAQSLRAFSAYSPMAGDTPLVSVIFCRAAALRVALDARDGLRPAPPPAAAPSPGKTAVFRYAMPFSVGADGRGAFRGWVGTGTMRTISPDDARPALSLRTPGGRISLRRMGAQWLRPVLAPDSWEPMRSRDLIAAVASPPAWNDNPYVAGPRGRGPAFGMSEIPLVVAETLPTQAARATRAAEALSGKVGMLLDVEGIAYKAIRAPRVGVAVVGGERVPAWSAGDLASFASMEVRPTAPSPNVYWERLAGATMDVRDAHMLPCSLARHLPVLCGPGAVGPDMAGYEGAAADLVRFDDPDLLVGMQEEALALAAEWLRFAPAQPDVARAAIAELGRAAALHSRGMHVEARDVVAGMRLPRPDGTGRTAHAGLAEAFVAVVASGHGHVMRRAFPEATVDGEEFLGFRP